MLDDVHPAASSVIFVSSSPLLLAVHVLVTTDSPPPAVQEKPCCPLHVLLRGGGWLDIDLYTRVYINILPSGNGPELFLVA